MSKWYNIWRNDDGDVQGFIVDDFENPVSHQYEYEADEAVEGHILSPAIEAIKL